ncbi:MAG: hypothetical protein KAU21_02810 [Gammaproteobacteria bacterium]|nr:hypothetical protein [Gammaproteobacteria bacterium]
MNDINLRSEHIRRYEARLKHLDELLERARQNKIEETEHETELKELSGKRKQLASHVDEMRLKDLDNWRQEEIEKAGPMAVWDAVAQQLERLVEKFEKK